MTKQEKVKIILDRLLKIWPRPKTALLHTNALELLVATILSAQANDKTVNKVTPDLFAKYKTAQDYANVSFEELDKDISKINFHTNKAKNVIAMAKILVEKHNGEIPNSMEDLVKLPGVGRKTANVVLGDVFNNPQGIVVDTHVKRLANKLGLTEHTDPVKIERDLMEIVPKEHWVNFSHLLIYFGREYYTARMKSGKDTPLGDLFEE